MLEWSVAKWSLLTRVLVAVIVGTASSAGAAPAPVPGTGEGPGTTSLIKAANKRVAGQDSTRGDDDNAARNAMREGDKERHTHTSREGRGRQSRGERERGKHININN